MAKRQAQSSTPLTGAVQRVGVRPTVARTQRAAAVADLRVRFTGGKAGAVVKATLTVTLNTRIGGTGTARLADETQTSAITLATRTSNAYVFENVQFPAPGATAARVFRITNIRANANGLGGGSVGTTPVQASIAITGPTPIRLSNGEQTVAVVEPLLAAGGGFTRENEILTRAANGDGRASSRRGTRTGT